MSPSDLERTCLELVGIPSVTGHEEGMCSYLVDWASRRLPQARLERWRNGLIVDPDPTRTGPRLGLFGHVDTVPPADPQTTEYRDGRIYGCGASDMKAGLAVMMALLEGDGPWVGVFYDREEGPYRDNGLDPLLDRLMPIELAIVLEPTSNRIQAGCVGSLQARVTTHGRRAHSARPWQGENAVYKAIPLLSRLAARERVATTVHGLTFYQVVSLTQASTLDNPTNAVPGTFRMNLNYRFAPGTSLEQARSDLEQLVAGQAELEILDEAPAGNVCLDQPRLAAWIAAERLEVESKQAWTDVARLTGRQIPAVNFGPGEPAQAHQAMEWCLVESLHGCYQALRRLP